MQLNHYNISTYGWRGVDMDDNNKLPRELLEDLQLVDDLKDLEKQGLTEDEIFAIIATSNFDYKIKREKELVLN